MKIRNTFKVKFSGNFLYCGADDCRYTLCHKAISCHAAGFISSRIHKKKVITLVPTIIVNVSSVSKERNSKDILNS